MLYSVLVGVLMADLKAVLEAGSGDDLWRATRSTCCSRICSTPIYL